MLKFIIHIISEFSNLYLKRVRMRLYLFVYLLLLLIYLYTYIVNNIFMLLGPWSGGPPANWYPPPNQWPAGPQAAGGAPYNWNGTAQNGPPQNGSPQNGSSDNVPAQGPAQQQQQNGSNFGSNYQQNDVGPTKQNMNNNRSNPYPQQNRSGYYR